jgi:Flp pilus assembly protein TadD
MTLTQRLDLASRLVDEGRYAAGLRLVEPLTAKAPRTKEELTAYRILARANYGLRHFGKAEMAARRVITRRPKDAETMRLLVRSLQREGRHRDAAEWMTKLDALGTDTWDDDSGVLSPRRPAPSSLHDRSGRSRAA